MEIATIQKWGNSQGIRIPKYLLNSLQWKQGEKITVTIEDKKLIMEQVPISRHKNIKELFQDFHSENYNPSEIDWGKNVGEELW